jgi:plasmid stabilization system protein ParE
LSGAKLLASAREDIRLEKYFYPRVSPDLALQFQIAIEKAIRAAAEQALAMQVLEFGIRRWPLEGFPHGVLYRIERDVIIVLSVFHPGQDPEKWRSRART